MENYILVEALGRGYFKSQDGRTFIWDEIDGSPVLIDEGSEITYKVVNAILDKTTGDYISVLLEI